MGGKTKRPKFAEGVSASAGGETKRVLPSHIRADHADNQRWSGYPIPSELLPYFTGAFCFRLETIEQRLRSLQIEGQIEPIKISISGTGHPDLEVGFLRHCAFVLAEVRGILDTIPGAKGTKVTGIRCEVVRAAKSQKDRALAARRNRAENRERVNLSPVDTATYFRRRLNAVADDGSRLTKQDLAAEESRSIDYVNKHLRLLMTLKPAELLEVHEGRETMASALRKASKEGRGNNPGPRGKNPGVSHSTARKRLAVIDSTELPATITPRDIMISKLMAGALDERDASVPEDLREFVGVLRTAPPKPQKKPPKRIDARPANTKRQTPAQSNTRTRPVPPSSQGQKKA